LSRAAKLWPGGAALLAAFLMLSCSSNGAHSSAATVAVSPSPQTGVSAGDVAPPAAQTGGFDGAKAYDHVAKLVGLGPHSSGSDGIREVQNYIRTQLQTFGCTVEEDDFHAQSPMGSLPMKNLVAKVPGTGRGILLLLTHYDTKRVPNFVGAEDSGSSTGLMLEMARLLCGRPKQPNAIWIAFLDGEETQASFNWSDEDSLYGSRELAARLALSGDLKRVRAAILADMVGQKGLHIERESDSTKWLSELVFKTAARLGYRDAFPGRDSSQITDDHEPFLHRGVAAVDLIDLSDYQAQGYWHTAQDTLDEISPRSLAIVGHVTIETVNELQARFHAP
jgi:Peptidase family M28